MSITVLYHYECTSLYEYEVCVSGILADDPLYSSCCCCRHCCADAAAAATLLLLFTRAHDIYVPGTYFINA